MYKIILPLFLVLILFLEGCGTPEPKPEPMFQETNTSKITENPVVQKPQVYEKVFRECFQTGRVNLTKKCKTNIQTFIENAPTQGVLLIEVHTDKGGKASRNLSISKKRAYKIAHDLHNSFSGMKIYYAGLGEKELLVDEHSKEADTQNRRVFIKLQKKEKKVASNRFTLYKKIYKKRVKPSSKKSIKKEKKPLITHVDSRYKNVKNNPLNFKSSSLVRKEIQINKLLGDAINPLYKEKIMHTCNNDGVIMMDRRDTRGMKSSEFIKNMDGRTYRAEVDNYTIVLNPLFLFKDGSLSQRNPKVKIYKNGFKKRSFSTTANAYLTKRGVLYRLFSNANDSIQCIDLLLPYDETQKHYGFLYFVEKGRLKELVFEPYVTQ